MLMKLIFFFCIHIVSFIQQLYVNISYVLGTGHLGVYRTKIPTLNRAYIKWEKDNKHNELSYVVCLRKSKKRRQ